MNAFWTRRYKFIGIELGYNYVISVQIRLERRSKKYSKVGERSESWITFVMNSSPSIFAVAGLSAKLFAKDSLVVDAQVGGLLVKAVDTHVH